MKNNIKHFKLAILAGVLPFIYGCGSGGSGALLSFLFGAGGGFTGGGGGGGGTGCLINCGVELATLHQPEPTSMLLIGGGLAAMTYFKSKTSRHGKK